MFGNGFWIIIKQIFYNDCKEGAVDDEQGMDYRTKGFVENRYAQTNRILRMCSEGVVGCLRIL